MPPLYTILIRLVPVLYIYNKSYFLSLLGLLAFCCPCILIGNNADVVGENKTLCCLLSCVTLWFAPTFLCYVGYLVIRMMLRGKIRQQKNIDVRTVI
jgi:hypothetical protein